MAGEMLELHETLSLTLHLEDRLAEFTKKESELKVERVGKEMDYEFPHLSLTIEEIKFLSQGIIKFLERLKDSEMAQEKFESNLEQIRPILESNLGINFMNVFIYCHRGANTISTLACLLKTHDEHILSYLIPYCVKYNLEKRKNVFRQFFILGYLCLEDTHEYPAGNARY